MTFGWQGFCFEHPDDWAPVSLTGSCAEGYARISSPRQVAVQVRWSRVGGIPDLDAALAKYRSRLERDARKSGEAFQMKLEAAASVRVRYHWSGAGQGRGAVFACEACSRVFLLEVVGSRKDSLLPTARAIVDGFHCEHAGARLWSVLGLRVALPAELRLEGHRFQAGRTQLQMTGRGCRLECVRWGFAEQLLRRYRLEDWARSSLELSGAHAAHEDGGLRLTAARLGVTKEAIVSHDSEHNQITTVKATFRNGKWKPQWEWLS